jgi:hypothetical protein
MLILPQRLIANRTQPEGTSSESQVKAKSEAFLDG